MATNSSIQDQDPATSLAPNNSPPQATAEPTPQPAASDQDSTPASDRRYRSDPALVQACLAGDETGWRELVDRYKRLVYSIPRHYGLSDSDAEDVFQNVFAIVLRQLGNLRDPTRLSAWLITITHRQTQQLVRHSARFVSTDQDLDLADEPSLEEIHRWEQRQLLHEAMSRLDPRCQQILTILLQEEKPNYEELAQHLGMAVGSIGPTRARCFKKLEAILIELGFES